MPQQNDFEIGSSINVIAAILDMARHSEPTMCVSYIPAPHAFDARRAACRLLTTAAALWDRETSAPPHKGRRPIQRFGRLQIEKAAQDFNLDDVGLAF